MKIRRIYGRHLMLLWRISMLTKESIDEFKKIYLQEYGVNLTDEAANIYGSRLVGLVKAVYGDDLSQLIFDKGVRKDNNRIELRKRLGFLMPSLDRT